jgi:hypothetical protein
MAVPVGNIAQITVSGKTFEQTWSNVYTYQSIIWPGLVTAEQAAEAYWNQVKAAYRALFPVGWAEAFSTVTVVDISDPSGDYAVYGIPSAERAGTRSNPSGDPAPPFLSIGVRLNVPSRVTRPGQKRYAGMYEVDMQGDTATSGYITLIENAAAATIAGMVLGAPAATVSLNPVVVKRDPATGGVLTYQSVTSTTVNTRITTQNTRKIGRGN